MEVRNSSWVFKGRGLCKRNLGQSGWVVIVLVGKKKFFKMVGDVCGGFVAMDMDTMETPSAMG